MINQRGCMRVCTRVRRGLPLRRMLPSVLSVRRRLKVMVIQGEKKLMLKVLLETLKRLIDRFLRKL